MNRKFNKQEKEILSKLTRWCAVAERCPADVYLWFKRRKLPTAAIDKYLDYLTAQDYINVVRYANAFVHDAFLFNKWGKMKIFATLLSKNIPEQIITTAIKETINEEEYINMLQNLLEKKKKLLQNEDFSIVKQKIRNFAVSKGFEPEIVYKLTEKMMKK